MSMLPYVVLMIDLTARSHHEYIMLGGYPTKGRRDYRSQRNRDLPVR